MKVRAVVPGDAAAWERMREALWPPDTAGEHAAPIAQFFSGDRHHPAEVLLAIDDSNEPIGFAEMSIRAYAEGCDSRRVAYLEGWYVDPQHRRQHVGAALVRAVEDWGRAMGCTELGSDVVIDNSISITAHHALGFDEVVRIVCLRKDL